MRKTVLLLIMLSLQTWGATDAAPQAVELFHAGNNYFKKGDFSRAIASYSYIIDSLKIADHRVYYNLANSYHRAGNVGMALVNYERALKLAPRDQDILSNIAFLRALTKDTIEPRRRFILFRWLAGFFGRLSRGELVAITEVFYLLFMAILSIMVMKRNWIGSLIHTCTVAGILLVFFTVGLGVRLYHDSTTTRAVILQPKVDIYSGPAESNTRLFILHEGTVLRLMKEQEGWYLFGLANGEKGWIRKDTVEEI